MPKAPPRRAATAPRNAASSVKNGVDNRRSSVATEPDTRNAHAPPNASDAEKRPNTQQAQQIEKESQIPGSADDSAIVLESHSPDLPTTDRERPLGHQQHVSGAPDKPSVAHTLGVEHTVAQQNSPEAPHVGNTIERSNATSGNNVPSASTQAIESRTISPLQSIQSERATAIQRPSSIPVEQTPAIAISVEHETNANVTRPPLSAENVSAVSTAQEFQRPALPQNKRRRTNTEASDATSVEGAKTRKPRGKRKREPTPEESEQVEIAPTVVKMSELCKDLRTGKKSKREIELRSLEVAEAERKQKAREREKSRNSDTPVKADVENGSGASSLTPSKSQTGPRMRIVNGEIVIDNASLQFDQRAEAARQLGEMQDVVENRLNRKVNQATYGKRTKVESWDEELTDLFYRGLRMFGTDFSLISNMFPGRSRRQIKLKFNNEERRDPERIKRTLLGPREHIDIQTYSELTNKIYEDPEVIQKELDDDKKRIEEQHAKEKQAQDEQIRNPGGASIDANVVQSIENVPLKRNSTSKSH